MRPDATAAGARANYRVYTGLGKKDQALASLEKAYEARSWYISWLKVEPALDSLREDARFKDLVRRVGFSL